MTIIKQLLSAILLSLSLLFPAAIQAEDKLPSGETYQELGPKIEAFVDKHKETTAGMETAVFTADDTLYQGHFGYLDKENKIKAGDNSVFEWGSTSKTTVWISVMQQVEAGKIDLKEDIRAYLPKGFLRNLRFDKTVSLLDIMNHRAGFQESQNYFFADNMDPKKLISLEDYLTKEQPLQVYEPDTVTAYSNWGTALAAYIVQRVSKQDFADYVHQHIFEPLGMEHSSIKVDRSDNLFVKKQRALNKSYDTKGKVTGDPFIFNPYPAGSIIGTLADLKTYAQALLKQEEGVLFDKKETWQTLFSPSHSSDKTHIPLNNHGFLVTQYAVPTVGHGGQTRGYSNNLILDLESGVGMVVMTNQAQEEVYNVLMPELVFGSYKDSPLAQGEKGTFETTYLSSRVFLEGPLSSTILFNPEAFLKRQQAKEVGQRTYLPTSQTQDGRASLQNAVNDFLALSTGQIAMIYGSLILGGLALAYSLATIFYRLARFLYTKLKKQVPVKTRTNQGWASLTSGLIVGIALAFLAFSLSMMINPTLSHYVSFWFPLLISILSLNLISCGLWFIFRPARGRLNKVQAIHQVILCLAILATLFFVYYWDLYQWWSL